MRRRPVAVAQRKKLPNVVTTLSVTTEEYTTTAPFWVGYSGRCAHPATTHSRYVRARALVYICAVTPLCYCPGLWRRYSWSVTSQVPAFFFSNPLSPPGSFVYHSHVLRSFKVGAHNNRILFNSSYSLPLQRRVYISTWHIEPERSFNPSMCYQEDFVSLALLNSNEKKEKNAQGFFKEPSSLSLPEGSGPGIDSFNPESRATR